MTSKVSTEPPLSGVPDDAGSFAGLAREQVVSLVPFTVRRVARWSECDPAGVVYVGNFTDYLLSAVHLFRLRLFGADWGQLRDTLHVDLPAKAISMVFNGSLWPNNVFDVTVHVGEVRTRTFDILAEALRSGSGEPVFQGRLSAICVSAADRRVSEPLPQELRTKLRAAASLSPAPGHLNADHL